MLVSLSVNIISSDQHLLVELVNNEGSLKKSFIYIFLIEKKVAM